jgi:hypothetical protein
MATLHLPHKTTETSMALRHLITAAFAIASVGIATTAHAGKTLDAVKARGQLICGVNTSGPGFSNADSQGKWTGLDVDFCRAVAARGRDRGAVAQQHLDLDPRRLARRRLHRHQLLRWPGLHGPEEVEDRQRQEAQRRDHVRAGRHHQREERGRLLRCERHEVQIGRVRHRRGDHQRLLRRTLPGLHHRHERSGRRTHQGTQCGGLRDPAAGHLERTAGRVCAPR